MAILIDSTVLIEHERGKLNLQLWLALHRSTFPVISVISLVELYHGLYRAIGTPFYTKRLRYINQCRHDYCVLAFEESLAEAAGKLRADLNQQGVPIGPHDLLIATTALEGSHSLATSNIREFSRVPNLKIMHWHGCPPLQT